MADGKKIDLEDLDLSNLGKTISSDRDSSAESDRDSKDSDDSKKDSKEFDDSEKDSKDLDSNGYWVNQKPISKITHIEMAEWITTKLPSTNVEGFNKSAFNTTLKRQLAVDKVINIYLSVRFLFPIEELPREYLN